MLPTILSFQHEEDPLPHVQVWPVTQHSARDSWMCAAFYWYHFWHWMCGVFWTPTHSPIPQGRAVTQLWHPASEQRPHMFSALVHHTVTLEKPGHNSHPEMTECRSMSHLISINSKEAYYYTKKKILPLLNKSQVRSLARRQITII
jgi:hypothetical protein